MTPALPTARLTRVAGPLALLLGSLLVCESGLRLAERSSRVVHGLLMPPARRDAPLLREGGTIRGNPYHREHDEAGYRNATRLHRADLVVLGDSQAYGSGVAPEHAWPARLGAYNMALPGHGPGHSLLQVDEALALRPRAVVVAIYFGNDFIDVFWLSARHPHLVADVAPALRRAAEDAERRRPILSEAGAILRQPRPGAGRLARVGAAMADRVKLLGLVRAAGAWLWPPPPLALLSRDFDVAVAALTPAQRQYAVPVAEDGWRTILTPDYRGRVQDDEDPRVRLGFQATVSALRRIHERTRAAGVRLLVVLIPTKERVFWPRGRSDMRLQRLVAHETGWHGALTSALDAHGIGYVEALPALAAARRQPYFEDVDAHPNEEGHRLIAGAVSAALR
jgi:lysophospholipase L1-like esterase